MQVLARSYFRCRDDIGCSPELLSRSLARRGPSNDAHSVTRFMLRNSDASYGQAYRSVVVQNRLDCYLHGCPCGYYGDPRRACSCAPGAIGRYQKRESTGDQAAVPTPLCEAAATILLKYDLEGTPESIRPRSLSTWHGRTPRKRWRRPTCEGVPGHPGTAVSLASRAETEHVALVPAPSSPAMCIGSVLPTPCRTEVS